MTFYIILAFAAFLLSLLGTRLMILAQRQRPVPIDHRNPLKKPVPRGGGLVVVMTLIICLLVADIHYGVILALFMLAAISLLDEVIGVALPVRLLVQLLAVLLVLGMVHVPVFGGVLPLWLDRVIAALLWLWFINLFSFMDGIDGIAPTEMICIGMGFFTITIMTGTFPTELSSYGLIVLAAGWGFLWWNWHPAKILFGEAGSVSVGFLLGYLLLLAILSGYACAAAILPAYYLSDATISMLCRLYRGKKFWGAHADHYYLHAVRNGRKPDAVVRTIFGVNILLILLAVFSVINPELAGFHVAVAYMGVFMILGFFAYTKHDPRYELFSPRFNRNALAVLHDAAMAAISFILSIYIRLGAAQWHESDRYLITGTIVFTAVSMAVFTGMRLYRGLWRYASMQDMVMIVKAVSLSLLIFSALMFTVNRLDDIPRSVPFINWMLLSFLLGGPRFLYRAFCDRTLSWRMIKALPRIPVLLVGAGNSAEQFIRDLSRDSAGTYEVVGLVDDDPRQKGHTIHRVRIYGGSDALPHIVRKLEGKGQRPQKIILADDRMPGATVLHLLEVAEGLGIPLARLPRLSEFKSGLNDRRELRPIAVEDLLGRAQNVLDRDAMRRLVEGRKVLITGAGGTIGSELTRQIASYGPSMLMLLEASEYNLYQIEREIRGAFPELPLAILLCDVRDEKHVDAIFRNHKPQLVFHAAAIKHVPMAEGNIEEAILTNVFGTRHIAEACRKHGVDVMVMISTDKAVNPANVMGATKRLAESFCQALGEMERGSGATKFITVRFGNVLGSTGSVVPLFQEQLSKGGPLTVTHPDMTRYFMTVREAVELVLQAAVLGVAMQERQECIFVLDMGQPVRILDLALQMIRLAGLKPYEDIKIIFTGLRPGEKFYEELFHFSENAAKTAHESIFLSQPRFTDMQTLRRALAALFDVCMERKTQEALALLKQLVPEFQSMHPTST